jgi:hypothetical protein
MAIATMAQRGCRRGLTIAGAKCARLSGNAWWSRRLVACPQRTRGGSKVSKRSIDVLPAAGADPTSDAVYVF